MILEKRFTNLSVFKVEGIGTKEPILVLSKTLSTAILATNTIESKNAKASLVDSSPLMRQCENWANEPLDFIEWYNPSVKDWEFIEIDHTLFKEEEIEILVKK